MAIESNIDVAGIVDEPRNFCQTLAFSAVVVPNKETAFEMFKALVEEFGVDPLKEDSLKQTPIFYAARDGNTNIISYLASRGENFNRADKYGQTPIYYAIREGNINCTQLLINLGANFDYADMKK